MKIEKSFQKINPFGGINFVIDAIRKSGLLQLFDNELGKRPPQSEYSYSDIILDTFIVPFCNADCIEDLNEHISPYLSDIPNLKIANSDTVLRVLKSMKTEKVQVKSSKGNVYEINRNEKLNQLNINTLKHLGLIKEGHFYDFDFDNEHLPTEKYDTKVSYKKTKGYFPSMATIEGCPVFFENRDANMNVKTNQAATLKECFKLLKNNNIYINRGRFDAGSYTKEVVEVVEKNCKKFYIRANKCESLTGIILQKQNWQKVEINNISYEVSSIGYRPFGGSEKEKKKYRLVIMRRKKADNQLDIFTGDNMEYRCILTNDKTSTEKEVVEYYNGRGAEERVIDVLNNDFCWSKMPFSFMEENTVFLMLMMICKVSHRLATSCKVKSKAINLQKIF